MGFFINRIKREPLSKFFIRRGVKNEQQFQARYESCTEFEFWYYVDSEKRSSKIKTMFEIS